MATKYLITDGPDRMSLMFSIFDYGAKVPHFTIVSAENPEAAQLVLIAVITGVARRPMEGGNHLVATSFEIEGFSLGSKRVDGKSFTLPEDPEGRATGDPTRPDVYGTPIFRGSYSTQTRKGWVEFGGPQG